MNSFKLVRDLIPDIIHREGRVPVVRVADQSEYRQRLKEKLLEEVNEFLLDESREEFADILEVLNAVCLLNRWDVEEVTSLRRKKAAERGSFAQRFILELP